MSGLGRLGEMYGLSPATMAGLAQIKGVPPPQVINASPVVIGNEPAPPPPVDENSPEAWAAAAKAAGAPGAVITDTGGSPNPLARSNPNSAPAQAAGVAPDNPAAAEAADRAKALAGADPQGPVLDTYPTVKPLNQDAVGGGMAAPVVPGRVVPAHWQPGSHSVAVQHGMDPEALADGRIERELGAQHGVMAADARLEAAQKAGMADAVYASAHAMASKQAADQMAAIEVQRQQYVKQEQVKLEQMAAETQKKVDPGAYWKEKGSGAKFAAALMIGLNQFAVMWRGRGTNTAMQIIDDEINRNIDAQKTNIANARSALDKRENLYARNLAVFGDKERAVLATKMQYLDQVSALADAKRVEAKSTEAEAGYHELRKSIYDQRAAHADDFAKLTETKTAEQMNEHFVPPTIIGGTAGVKGKDDHYVPTLGGYARSKEDAAKLNAKGALRMQISENAHQIYGLIEKAKSLNSVTDRLKLQQLDEQIDSLVDDSLTKNTVLEGQGAMSAADKEVAASAKSLKGVSVQWKPDFVLSKYQQNIKNASTNMLTHHRLEGEAFGVQKGTEQYVQTPTGPVPVQKLEGRNAPISKRTQGHDDLVQPPQGVAK